jgi:hypothetical protein
MHPTGPKDEGWFEWAEAETIQRLRRQIAERRAIKTPPPPAPARLVIESPAEITLEPDPEAVQTPQENLSRA